MASQYEIKIIVGDKVKDKDKVVGSGGNIAGMSQVATTENGTTQKTKEDNSSVKLGKYIASQTIGTFINNTKSNVASTIGLVTGRSELQERVNFGLEMAQKGTNTIKNAQAGAILATSVGLSSGIGAVIGVALSVISEGINLAFRQAQLNLAQGIEARQLDQVRTRAGASFNRSRSGT